MAAPRTWLELVALLVWGMLRLIWKDWPGPPPARTAAGRGNAPPS